MSLDQADWLYMAKKLPVGGKSRGYHRRERRPNLVIGHEADRYWAYCQRCKCGSTLLKEHACMTEPVQSQSIDLPDDMVFVDDLHHEHPVLDFLYGKGMYFSDIKLMYSPSRKRVMVPTPQGFMGRDITGRSAAKWMTYHHEHFLIRWPERQENEPDVLVLVEDTFSWLKVNYVIGRSTSLIGVEAVCTLGTSVHDTLLAYIVENGKHVLMFYDGDGAGESGAKYAAKRMRALGINVCRINTPRGFDPKDMFVDEIHNHIVAAVRRLEYQYEQA